MFKQTFFMMVALLLLASIAAGQEEEPARVRVMQLSYVADVGALADVQIDEDTVFEAISYPFATAYFELESGSHTLTTTLSGKPEFSASTSLELEAGHDYSIVVDGDYSQGVTFIVIDEQDALTDFTGSAALIVNLTEQPITDITLNDEPALEIIAADGFGILGLPETEFTLGGRLGDLSYSEPFIPHANTLFLVAVVSIPSGEPQVIYQRSSALTAAGYLRSVGEDAQFSRIAALINNTELLDSLADEGEFTLFLPVNTIMEDAPPLSDVDELAHLLSDHVVAGNLPPYLLPQHENLTTLSGDTVSLNFGSTASGYWEIEGAPILWDVRLANGVIYGINGVIK